MSVVLMLLGLVVIGWLLRSRLIMLCAGAIFLFYPVIYGNVTFDISGDYLVSVVSYWLEQIKDGLYNFFKEIIDSILRA